MRFKKNKKLYIIKIKISIINIYIINKIARQKTYNKI